MCRVTLFRNFAEDQRTSMEIYADNLLHNLQTSNSKQFELCDYRPRLNGLTKVLTNKAMSGASNGFEDILFVPRAIPEINFDTISQRQDYLKTFRKKVFI